MRDSTPVMVGLDVHKVSVRLAAVRADELVEECTVEHDLEVIEARLRAWPGARCCYEAGPTGFGLYRHLTAAGIACEVIAPSLVPARPGDRVKTDRRDARKLAFLYGAGLLEAIEVPTPEREAARDLVRAREDARLDRMRDRHRLSKFMLRHGRSLVGESWGVTRRRALASETFAQSPAQQTFETYLHAVDLVDRRIEILERQIAALSLEGPWAPLVAKLRCLRGVDTLTALGLTVEIGDFSRFKTAHEFMAYVGLVPSERSSGEQRRQGSITKAGNTHVRRLLIEAAWHARRPPKAGKDLLARQRGQHPVVIERAWRCQQRLHTRWRRMAGRGKPQQKIVVACARELAGFIWAIATDQPLTAN
jgi:transposase